jgi:hypothetical protein
MQHLTLLAYVENGKTCGKMEMDMKFMFNFSLQFLFVMSFPRINIS